MSYIFASRKLKRKNIRKNISGDDDGDAGDNNNGISRKLEAIKQLQESRTRHNGLNAVECALGKALAAEFALMDDDPFRQRGGGMLRLSDGRQAQMNAASIEADIRDQFKRESFLRDENEEMQKFIRAELKKRSISYRLEKESSVTKTPTVEDVLMLKAAERIKPYQSQQSDELLSNQMLAGIPEVELGIGARMNNIVMTELKKNEMMKNAGEKRHKLTE